MAKPEEFLVHIDPDGRIRLEMDGVQETSYRRIIELLKETIGPVQEVEMAPQDPPTRHIHHTRAGKTPLSQEIDLGRADES